MRTFALAALIATVGAFSAYAQDVPTPLPDPSAPNAPGATEAAGEDQRAEKQSIAALAAEDARLATLSKALRAAGLDETLQASGPFTVFAPSNDAFAAVGEATLAAWMAPQSKAALANTLSYHVVAGTIRSQDIPEGATEVPTLQGGFLTVVKTADGITVNGARVSEGDLMASNGVIHIIDKVAEPPASAIQ